MGNGNGGGALAALGLTACCAACCAANAAENRRLGFEEGVYAAKRGARRPVHYVQSVHPVHVVQPVQPAVPAVVVPTFATSMDELDHDIYGSTVPSAPIPVLLLRERC